MFVKFILNVPHSLIYNYSSIFHLFDTILILALFIEKKTNNDISSCALFVIEMCTFDLGN